MKHSVIFFLLMVTALHARCQEVDSLTLSQLKLNFAIPDIPAFKIFGSDPSNLLKPASPKALSVAMSPFYDKRQIIIPKSFAMELSPALLLNSEKGPVELVKYAENALINSFRISLGTETDTTFSPDGRKIAIGFRITPVNDGDLSVDVDFQKKISKKLGEFRKRVREIYLVDFARMNNIDVTKVDWDLEMLSDKKLKSRFDDYINSREDESVNSINKVIDQMKTEYKKDNWNANKLDIAFALLSSSSDSLAKNIRFNRAEIWLTYSVRCGKKGQLVFGLNNSINKNIANISSINSNETFVDMSLPVRYLLGTNRLKTFAEFQYEYKGIQKASSTLVNFGIESGLIDGLWMDFAAGLTSTPANGTSSFITNLNVKLTLPENFKFF
jgi:hypothetical protein